MTAYSLIMVGAAVCLVGAGWYTVRRRIAARDQKAAAETALRDLYNRYSTGIKAATQEYLLQTPADEEWLAGIKERIGADDAPDTAGNAITGARRTHTPPRETSRARREGKHWLRLTVGVGILATAVVSYLHPALRLALMAADGFVVIALGGVVPALSASRDGASVAATGGPVGGGPPPSPAEPDPPDVSSVAFTAPQPHRGGRGHGAATLTRPSTRHRIALRSSSRPGAAADERTAASVISWTGRYLRQALVIDGAVALVAGLLALRARLDHHGHVPVAYVALTFALPFAWIACVALARGYEGRFIGTGADEFRRIINAGIALTGAVAILSYATTANVARGYVVVAMPCVVALDSLARYWLRKRLHRVRTQGGCMRRAVAVGHPQDVEALINELRREPHHGLSVVAVCLADTGGSEDSLQGIPVHGGLADVMPAVRQSDADTVAVLACPEMNGVELRKLAWELEKTDTDLCLAPALLDVSGPRTSIRSAAGLPLLFMDHPDLTGLRQAVKNLFDRLAAFSALLVLTPLFMAIAVMIKLVDGGPVFFRQVRVGKNGRPFYVYKFRTMARNAEQQKPLPGEGNGLLFKIKDDPRVTRTGIWLRRFSLDELPQLFNVLAGQMSLVGPRPALPEEAARYGDYVRRRLAVRPGITGLWQVSGRSDLPWEEAVRLDLRYVENWSFALDLQILWKTWSAVTRGDGAY